MDMHSLISSFSVNEKEALLQILTKDLEQTALRADADVSDFIDEAEDIQLPFTDTQAQASTMKVTDYIRHLISQEPGIRHYILREKLIAAYPGRNNYISCVLSNMSNRNGQYRYVDPGFEYRSGGGGGYFPT